MASDRFLRTASLMALALATTAHSAHAQSFTVGPGETRTTTQSMSGVGDTGIIELGGAITTTDLLEDGIDISASDVAVTNRGTITIFGTDARGIRSSGANAEISNSGTIEITGERALGVRSSGVYAKINNSGMISTLGGGGQAIWSSGFGAAISNSGTITTQGNNGDGFYSSGAHATLINSGTISTSGQYGYGVFSFGSDAVIGNSGTILTTGENGYGIRSSGATATISNTGLISTSGNFGNGIDASRDNVVIKNEGTIATAGSEASGVTSDGNYAVTVNSGTISTSDLRGYGVQSIGADAVISNTGMISTSGEYASGVYSSGANAVIDNSETISTTGQNGSGITSYSSDAVISNTGKILTTGGAADGIFSHSTAQNVLITNDGTISTIGSYGKGMDGDGNGAVVWNNGTISTTGLDADGLRSGGIGAVIGNSGTISTTGYLSQGVWSHGGDSTVVNSGAISTTGDAADGLRFTGANAVISNSGTISAKGAYANGLYASGTNALIFNSGTISATGFDGHAIYLNDPNSSLTLLPGSIIDGSIHYDDVTDANSATLNITNGLSTALTISGAMPGTINVDGMVHAIDHASMRVVTADVSTPKASGTELGALLDIVFGALATRGTAGTNTAPIAPLGYAASPAGHEAFAFLDENQNVVQAEAWLRGFGSRSATPSPTTPFTHENRVIGAMAGLDLPLTATDTFGFFLGNAWGRSDTGAAGGADENTILGGLYSSHRFGLTTLDLALAFGSTRYNSTRPVADNMAPGGMAMARADFGGTFFAPELGLTHELHLGQQAIQLGGSLRYAGLFLDGYSETGTVGALTLDPRATHQLTARASIAIPFELSGDTETITRLTPKLGIEATTHFGDPNITGSLLGNAIRFNADTGTSIKALGGLRLEHEVAGKWSLFGEAEAGLATHGATHARASAGFNASF